MAKNNSPSPGVVFLTTKFKKFADTPETQAAINRAKKHGEVTENLSPQKRVEHFVDLTERILSLPQEKIIREDYLESIKNTFFDIYIIQEKDIPERVYILEQEIAHQMGHGVVTIDEAYRKAKNQEIISGQRGSLSEWIDYLGSSDAIYPTWAKIWVIESIVKLGKYNKGEKKFEKRGKNSVSPFPIFNIGALAKSIETIQKKILKEQINNTTPLSDNEFQKILQKEDFGSLYALYLSTQVEYSESGLENIRGEWVYYPQWSEPDDLYRSLQGHPLEWCTAQNIETARGQLQGGDFYVYYSEDTQWSNAIPRVAIRMEENRIAEVRGIQSGQGMDPYILPVVEEKMKEFGDEGKIYLKRVADMRLLGEIFATQIEVIDLSVGKFKSKKDAPPLSRDDLLWLLQADEEIDGFGYGRDPRIHTILSHRNISNDLEGIFPGIKNGDNEFMRLVRSILTLLDIGILDIIPYRYLHKEIVLKLIECEELVCLEKNLEKFTGLTPEDNQEIALKLIESEELVCLERSLEKFRGLHKEIALKLIEESIIWLLVSALEKFTGLTPEDHKEIALKLIESEELEYLVKNLEKFTGLTPEDHKEIMIKLIVARRGWSVADYPEIFTGITPEDHKEIILKLIEAGKGEYVIRHLEEFTGLTPEDHKEIGLILFEAEFSHKIRENP